VKDTATFVKYTTVGIAGTCIDVGSLYVLVDVVHLPVLLATVVSFLLAALNNFFLNKIWTFHNDRRAAREQFVKFIVVSSIGLVLTVACMAVLVFVLRLWYIGSKLLTSLIVLFWNFLANKFWTFKDAVRGAVHCEHYPFDVSVVIPAFNEELRVGSTLEAVDRYFSARRMTREIIVVDDGSTDGTAALVNAMQEKIRDLKLIRYAPNRGKGWAVRKGIEGSSGEYILFTDADNSTPIEEFEKFYPLLKDHEIVIGSRYVKGSNITIKQPAYRILLGRAGNFLIQSFLFDEIRDTQCGFKAFQHSAAKDVFRRMTVNRFGFDIELLSVAKLLKYSIREVPINWYNSPQSRVRPIKDACRTFVELLRVKINIWGGRYQ
jgi:dolichyl-phosphate beta-glucosyltransferase